jgi:hypothetical protein
MQDVLGAPEYVKMSNRDSMGKEIRMTYDEQGDILDVGCCSALKKGFRFLNLEN